MHEPRDFTSRRRAMRTGGGGEASAPGANVPPGGAALKSLHASPDGKSRPSRRLDEASEDYPHVVAMLDADTRVIECAQGIQWIIQKRRSGRWPWRSRYFCRTKEGLLLYAGPTVPELLTLPDHFARRTGGEWIERPSAEGAS